MRCTAWWPPPRESTQSRCSLWASTDFLLWSMPAGHLSCSPNSNSPLGTPSGRTLCPHTSLGKHPDYKYLLALPLDGTIALIPRAVPRNMSTLSLCHSGSSAPLSRSADSTARPFTSLTGKRLIWLFGFAFCQWKEAVSSVQGVLV